jgi:hypothetical protein
VRGLTVDKIVVVCILVNAYTTYPCLVLVIQARAPGRLGAQAAVKGCGCWGPR